MFMLTSEKNIINNLLLLKISNIYSHFLCKRFYLCHRYNKMKWIIFNITLVTWNCIIFCQDIVFPNDEEMSHVSGNTAVITYIQERQERILMTQCEKMFCFR